MADTHPPVAGGNQPNRPGSAGPARGGSPPAFGWQQIGDCGALRVVGIRLQPGQRVPEHRTAIPAALIVTEGELRYSEGEARGSVAAGELLLVNPGERHSYWAEVPTGAYIVYAGLPGSRHRPWALRRRDT